MGEPASVVVLGTATEVGKTWVASRMVTGFRRMGLEVAVRKPVQSYDPDSDEPTDSAVLAAASGEPESDVCAEQMCFEVPMAPPMAAEVLGRRAPYLEEHTATMTSRRCDLTLVETVGGVLSPIAADAHSAAFANSLQPTVAVLVADAGLGVIDSVRKSMLALSPLSPLVYLNRFDPNDELHRLNRRWLSERDRIETWVDMDEFVDAVLVASRGEP
ncbi:MAG: dethiobiotin synthase [Microthrixaceae bacterium]|nr:dethiobiotin synthase [Microthrixaceae bacterium]